MVTSTPSTPIDEHQEYATVLTWGNRLGLLLLVLGFVSYVTGLLPGTLPLNELPQLWSLPLPEFLAQSQAPQGWNWLTAAGSGDGVAMLGILTLGCITVVSYSFLVVRFLRTRETLRLWMALGEIAVTVVAALGWGL